MSIKQESESIFLPQEYEKKVKKTIINESKEDGKLSLCNANSKFVPIFFIFNQ